MKVNKDSYRHKGMRQKMVFHLKKKGITDSRVLHAMSDLPRHYFLDKAFEDWAYRDVAFQIDADQTISQPYTVAMQSQLLELSSSDKVLEIGTGSGYQACILHKLSKKVYTIERQAYLYHYTDRLFKKLGFTLIRNVLGDGFAGLPRFAPFDKILVTCGAPSVPQRLLDQLALGGIMVIPVGEDGQEMRKITKSLTGEITTEIHGECSFVPMLSGINHR